jgi:hypothetical protein
MVADFREGTRGGTTYADTGTGDDNDAPAHNPPLF